MKNKKLPSLLGFISIILLTFTACGTKPTPAATPMLAETATLSDLQGEVGLKNPGEAEFSAAASGNILQVEGQVQTGADGRVRLDLSTGTIVRVAPDSLFTLVSNQPEKGNFITKLSLLAGKIWITLSGGQMEVETPSGVASVRGSYMTVWVDPDTSDVWVSCLEGWCQAGNSTSSIDLLASEGTILYNFDPNGTVPPPPPMLRYLSEQDIDDFVTNNPEVQNVMDSIAATASALPTLTATPTETPIPPTETSTPTITQTPTSTATFTPTFRPWPTSTYTSTNVPPPPPPPTNTFTPTGTGTPFVGPLMNINIQSGWGSEINSYATGFSVIADYDGDQLGVKQVVINFSGTDYYGYPYSSQVYLEQVYDQQNLSYIWLGTVDLTAQNPMNGSTVYWYITATDSMGTLYDSSPMSSIVLFP